MVNEENIWTALKEVLDPELMINVVDLGLVYKVELEGKRVEVDMTLTFPGCPLHTFITHQVQQKLLALEGIEEAEVNLVWEPPWNPGMMSEAARQQLSWAPWAEQEVSQGTESGEED
ncbi:MAG: metal-sulfur cluster assembly factor [Anaerolineae bacterium]